MLVDIKSRLDRIRELNKIIDGPISTKGEAAHRERLCIISNYESDVEYLYNLVHELNDIIVDKDSYMDNFKRDV